jgi:hypothetical protein
MAGNKYIANNAGTLAEVAASQVSTGAADAGKIPALDSTGKLDSSMMPVGAGSAETISVVASEAISAGAHVNLWTNAGVANVRNADASTSGKEANGFLLAGVASGATAVVYQASQTNTQLTGLTPGGRYFLSDATPGAVTLTVPTGTGKTVQVIGRAASATSMVFAPAPPITLA